MALTRKFLAAFGIEADKVDQIIEAHVETVDGLKKEIADLKEQVETTSKGNDAYDKLKQEYDNYKKEVQDKEVAAQKKDVLAKIAKDAGLTEAGVQKAIKYFDLSTLELDGEGNAKNSKDILKGIKEEWSDYIQHTTKEGATTATPPSNTGKSKMTKEQIMGIKDRGERQKAIAENHELFGF